MQLDESNGETAASMKSDIRDRVEYSSEKTGSSSRNHSHVFASPATINAVNSLAISVINISPLAALNKSSMFVCIDTHFYQWKTVKVVVRDD